MAPLGGLVTDGRNDPLLHQGIKFLLDLVPVGERYRSRRVYGKGCRTWLKVDPHWWARHLLQWRSLEVSLRHKDVAEVL